jgi:hypothetical protein
MEALAKAAQAKPENDPPAAGAAAAAAAPAAKAKFGWEAEEDSYSDSYSDDYSDDYSDEDEEEEEEEVDEVDEEDLEMDSGSESDDEEMLARIEKLVEIDQFENDQDVLPVTEEELLHPTRDTVQVMAHYSLLFALRHTYQVWPNGKTKDWERPLMTQLLPGETWQKAAGRMIKDTLLLWVELALKGRVKLQDRIKKQNKMAASGVAPEMAASLGMNEDSGSFITFAELEFVDAELEDIALQLLQEDTLLTEVVNVKDDGEDEDSDDGIDDDDDDDIARAEHKTHVKMMWVQADFSRLPSRLKPLLGLPGGQPFATTMGPGLSWRHFVWQPMVEWYEQQHWQQLRPLPLPQEESELIVAKTKKKLATLKERKGSVPTIKEVKAMAAAHALLQSNRDGNGIGCVGVGSIGPGHRTAGVGDAALDEFGPPVTIREAAVAGGAGSAIHYCQDVGPRLLPTRWYSNTRAHGPGFAYRLQLGPGVHWLLSQLFVGCTRVRYTGGCLLQYSL